MLPHKWGDAELFERIVEFFGNLIGDSSRVSQLRGPVGARQAADRDGRDFGFLSKQGQPREKTEIIGETRGKWPTTKDAKHTKDGIGRTMWGRTMKGQDENGEGNLAFLA